MQISVEELDRIKRRVTIQVPAQDIEPKVKDRLLSLSKRLKVNGFRPGKVPLKVAKGMYGSQVREEILDEVMQNSFQEALVQEKLNPVGAPDKVERKSEKEGEDLEYSVTFEVFPEFELQGVDSLAVERPVAEVTEADIDSMIETLRRQNTEWKEVERAAQAEDRVTVDFEGKCNGEDFPGSAREDEAVIIGSGKLVKGFEEALIGLKAGTDTEFDITYPENYPTTEVAGKTAHFKAKIHSVAEPILPEVDDEFIAKFDIEEGGIEGLRKVIRENMERELQQRIQSTVKNQLLDHLLNANEIPVPQAMINAQIEQMATQLNLPQPTKENAAMLAQLKSELFGKEAQRRAALVLIVSHLVKTNDIKLEESRVRSHLESLAATYEDPAQVIQWYEQNPKSLESIRALALEDQVTDWLLERAAVTDKPSSFEELTKPPQMPESEATEPESGLQPESSSESQNK